MAALQVPLKPTLNPTALDMDPGSSSDLKAERNGSKMYYYRV